MRQLAYNFRNWQKLEATGRGGSDDGFDVRGWEIEEQSPDEDEEEDAKELPEAVHNRLWLIQCKREKSINPKKLEKYLAEISFDGLYGIIFVAACDFSKKARDKFNSICRAAGVQEYHIWGKAELEDMLFQQKNDSLLFAYFGISLQIRRRTRKSEINATIAIKRKANRHLGEFDHRNHHRPILVRDSEKDHYPYSDAVPDFKQKPEWKMYNFLGYDYFGIQILLREFFAYIWEDGIHWDCVDDDSLDAGRPSCDPWLGNEGNDKINRLRNFWFNLPNGHKAWYKIIATIPYDKIITIDEFGDNILRDSSGDRIPHVFVEGFGKGLRFACRTDLRLIGTHMPRVEPDESKRKRFFPDPIPDEKPKGITVPE